LLLAMQLSNSPEWLIGFDLMVQTNKLWDTATGDDQSPSSIEAGHRNARRRKVS
jgi:hypothetical protein